MPDFIVIGAMKSATSTVCGYLEDHPAIYMVPKWEPNFFSHDENYAKGVSWYEAHFSGRTDEPLTGEGSNYYSARALHPRAAERMFAYKPDLKLIYMVRHPVDRIVSAWIQNRVDLGDEVPPTLDEAVRTMPDLYVGQSRYWYNLEPYRELFGDDRILIGFMEDLNRDPDTFFQGLCDFLGVPRADASRVHLNKSTGKLVPTTAYTFVNRLPYVSVAKSVVPVALRTAVKQRLLSRQIEALPQPSERTRAELTRVLQPDASALLQHCGRPPDFWRF